MSEPRTYRAPRGMRDVLPDEVPRWRRLEEVASRLARLRGFREIRPVLLEETELFTRSVGEVTDIVEKEMFTLTPGGKGARADGSLTLRPEGTAGIARAVLQAGLLNRAPLQRLFHVGPMFRYERPQKGRERMFTQFDVEAIGSLDPRLDAEVIHLAASFFEELGIRGLEVRLNSMGDGDDRDRYREAVRAFLAPLMDRHCDLCRARFERSVLRVLDCKNPSCQELHRGVPSILEFLSDENRAHFARVQELLLGLGRTVVVDPGIVRGLDYYTRTVFEVHYPALGARSALCGGGRYDHLVRDLGGPDVPAVGFAIGFTATLLVLEELGLASDAVLEGPTVLVATAEPADATSALAPPAFLLVEELRAQGMSAVFGAEGKSLKAQLKEANKSGARFAVVLGPLELERGVVQLKDLDSGEQVEVERSGLVAELRRRRAAAVPAG